MQKNFIVLGREAQDGNKKDACGIKLRASSFHSGVGALLPETPPHGEGDEQLDGYAAHADMQGFLDAALVLEVTVEEVPREGGRDHDHHAERQAQRYRREGGEQRPCEDGGPAGGHPSVNFLQ